MPVLMGKRFAASLKLISCFLCPARGTVLTVMWRRQWTEPAVLKRRLRYCLRQRAASAWEAELSGVWIVAAFTALALFYTRARNSSWYGVILAP